MAFAVQLLPDNLHYQSSTNPSKTLRNLVLKATKARHPNAVNKDYKPGANQTAREGDKKQVISDSKDYRPGENQTARRGNEKQVINDSKYYKPGDNRIGRLDNMKPLKMRAKVA